MNSVIDEFSLNDYEKVYLVYYWMGNNIEIDCSYTGKYESAVTVYTEGKSTHVGISSLFSTMVSNLGLRSNTIEGETKRTIDDPKGKKFLENSLIFGIMSLLMKNIIYLIPHSE
jgi:hypothetical protein